MAEPRNELELICADFAPALDLLRTLGMRLDIIWPADEPHSAILTGEGRRVRLTARPDLPPPSADFPAFRPELLITRAGTASGEGRAGMDYRDLIPGRLGGRYIASHIAIAEGGPIADWVHYHRIAFQLICVRSGWVRVVYEGQGDPFVMTAGDMVLQPPFIRHRVLESSAGLEVVEITCPACHETLADHDMALPNGRSEPDRSFGGQLFLHHKSAASSWVPWHGGEAQATDVGDATGGIAEARILRPGGGDMISVSPHDGELVFGFLLAGNVTLEAGGSHQLGPADCFVLPPSMPWTLAEPSRDFRLLHVTSGAVTG